MNEAALELIRRLDAILGEERTDEDFHLIKGSRSEAKVAAQELADRTGDDVAIVSCETDDDYMVLPLSQWLDPDVDDPESYTLVDVVEPSVQEAVASRRGLAVRMSAARIRGRPMGGKRLRAAQVAKAWRLAHPGKTRRKRMHTIYRDRSPLHPLRSLNT